MHSSRLRLIFIISSLYTRIGDNHDTRMSESKSLAIYNCQTCMFLTNNKKDYDRHVRSKKHRLTAFQLPTVVDDDTTKDDTFQKPSMCPNCHKVYKSRTSVYTHMKKCNVAPPTSFLPPATTTSNVTPPNPESLTPEQIRYILIENKILKELLKNAIHGSTV